MKKSSGKKRTRALFLVCGRRNLPFIHFIFLSSASSRLQDDKALTTFHKQDPNIYTDIYLLDPKTLVLTRTRHKQRLKTFGGCSGIWEGCLAGRKVGRLGDNVHFSGSNAYVSATMLICSSWCLLLSPSVLSVFFFCFWVLAAGSCSSKKVNTTGGELRATGSSHSVRVINYRIPGVLLKNMCVPPHFPFVSFRPFPCLFGAGLGLGWQRCPEEAPLLAKLLLSTGLSKIVHKFPSPGRNFSTGSFCLLSTHMRLCGFVF